LQAILISAASAVPAPERERMGLDGLTADT
jgi:hypothetical protein